MKCYVGFVSLVSRRSRILAYKSGLSVCLFSVSLTLFAAPAANGWTDYGSTEDRTYSIKDGSFEVVDTKGGDEVIKFIGRSYVKSTTTIAIRQFYVKVSDCTRGYGKLVALDMEGDYLYENDFAEGSGSVASDAADIACRVWKMLDENEKARGI